FGQTVGEHAAGGAGTDDDVIVARHFPPLTFFPGAVQHAAKRSDALQTRDRIKLGVWHDPGSAVHRHSASKTRVNALMALHRIRETQLSVSIPRVADQRFLLAAEQDQDGRHYP